MDSKQHTLEEPLGQMENEREIKKYLETNTNENTPYQNLWDSVKVLLKWKLRAINIHIKKEERSLIT